MARYFLVLDYNGTNFFGWQKQPNQVTVQGCIEQALSTLLHQPTEVTGCGRTDTGVHAANYVAHFDSSLTNLHTDSKFLYQLNSMLPYQICIKRIAQVHNEAHARFDATCRTYKYYLTTRKDPFRLEFAMLQRGSNVPNINLMNQAAEYLLQTNDFASFCKAGSDVKTTLCDVSVAKWEQQDDLLVFTISANRFLRNMVRAVVGTLLEVGTEKISIDKFCSIVESHNRGCAGTSADAKGLFLVDIKYPYEY